MTFHILETSLGPVQVAFDTEGALIYLGFPDHEFREALLAKVRAHSAPASPKTLARLHHWLEAYAQGHWLPFEGELRLRGTPFEQRVWQALRAIPFGQTRSYGQLLWNPRLSRAVGRANGANPISLIVPCHRVIGGNGSLTGYAGGMGRKAHLLRLEGLPIQG